jgi:phage terminase Nu1 subunit (DNA packaging protein)
MGRPLTTLPRYLDAGRIAEWRERSKATVYAWTRANKIQVDHVRESDGVSMYDTSDVAFWLDGPPPESEPVEGEREDADYGREHAELERAKRELAEIKVQEARGILINAAAARKVVADVGAAYLPAETQELAKISKTYRIYAHATLSSIRLPSWKKSQLNRR